MRNGIRRIADLAVPGGLAAISAWLWLEAGQMRGGTGRYETLGPSFFPKILLAGLLILCLLQVLRALAGRGGRRAEEVPRVRWRILATAVLATAAYAAALSYVGFLVSTLVFQVVLLTAVFGYRRLSILAGIPLGLTAIYGAIFVGLMNVPLPRGHGPFADISRLFY